MDVIIATGMDLAYIGTVVLRTTAIFLYAFILLRFLGKRRLAHLNYIDLLLIIAFGSAVGDVMIYDESIARFLTSVIAITVVAAVVKMLNEFSAHSVLVHHAIDGDARMVIHKGEILREALESEDLSEEALLSLLREKGIDSPKKVHVAFIEPDGEISLLPVKKR